MPDRAEDATRRTRLASERTYLAWWRTGLAALAVGIGAGKIAPNLIEGTTWPYVVVGVAYSIVGIAFIWYGLRRLRAVDEAIDRGEYRPPDNAVVVALTVLGVVLGLLTISLVVWQP